MNFYIPLSAFFLESGTQSFSSSLDNDLVTSISRFSYNFLRLFLLITTPATTYHLSRGGAPADPAPGGARPRQHFFGPGPGGGGPRLNFQAPPPAGQAPPGPRKTLVFSHI